MRQRSRDVTHEGVPFDNLKAFMGEVVRFHFDSAGGHRCGQGRLGAAGCLFHSDR